MVEEIKDKKMEKKTEEKDEVVETKNEEKKVEEQKTESKKPEVKKTSGKTEAVVNGQSLPVSTKQAVALCKFIKGKDVDKAIEGLELAKSKKKAIPMRGEIPHKKGIMSGRYMVNASGEFISLLKSVKANAIAHGLELEKLRLAGMANVAHRPARRGGRTKFKRTHVQVRLIPITKVGGKK